MEMPEQLRDLFLASQPDEAARQRAEAYQRAATEIEIGERQSLLRWQAIFCTCDPEFEVRRLDKPPGHAHCVIHGQFMITADGRVL